MVHILLAGRRNGSITAGAAMLALRRMSSGDVMEHHMFARAEQRIVGSADMYKDAVMRIIDE